MLLLLIIFIWVLFFEQQERSKSEKGPLRLKVNRQGSRRLVLGAVHVTILRLKNHEIKRLTNGGKMKYRFNCLRSRAIMQCGRMKWCRIWWNSRIWLRKKINICFDFVTLWNAFHLEGGGVASTHGRVLCHSLPRSRTTRLRQKVFP